MYNERERTFIKELVCYDFGVEEDTNKMKLFDSFLEEKIFNNENEIYVIVNQKGPHFVYYKKDNFNKTFCFLTEIFLLIKKLLDDKLMYLLPVVDKVDKVGLFGGLKTREEDDKYLVETKGYISKTDGQCTFFDNNNKKLYEAVSIDDELMPIKSLLGCWLIVTPELKKLVRNNFMTIHDKTLFWTRLTAGVSLLALFATLFISFCKTTTTRIERREFDRLIETIKENATTQSVLFDTIDNSLAKEREKKVIVDMTSSSQK